MFDKDLVISKLKDLVQEVNLVDKKKARILNLIIQIIQEILSDDDSDSLLVRHQEMKFLDELLSDDDDRS